MTCSVSTYHGQLSQLWDNSRKRTVRSVRLGILPKMSVKRRTWADIKARTKPDIRTRIEAEARRLSDDLRSEAEPQKPHSEGGGRSDLREPARDPN